MNDTGGLRMPHPRFRDITLASGLRLRYAEQGRPGGTPLLFLHGYGDSWFSFSAVMAALPEEVHALALDQRGYGDSDKPEAGYAMEDFAADAAAFLAARALPPALLIGHSMGSFIARQAALAAPGCAAGLVLIGSALHPANEGIRAFQDALRDLADPVPAAFAREFQAGGSFRPLPEEFFERIVAESVKAPARVWRGALAGLLAAQDAGRLGGLRVPALVLWGDRDSVFSREEQAALAAALPAARLKIYADTGHALPWEQPRACAADILEFLESLA
jgi:pimeloyl-ACP methyl ester carboxylesterase